MTLEELQTVTLNTPIFHPYFGEGTPSLISHKTITIIFENGADIRFVEVRKGTSDSRFIEELYLEPIKVVKK